MIKNRLLFVGISISILILLNILYVGFITNIFDGHVTSFGDYGYPEGHLNYVKLFFSVCFIVLLSYIVPLTANSPSTLILIIYYYVSIIPFLSLFTLDITASDSLSYIEFINIFIFYLVIWLFKKNQTYKINTKNLNILRLKYYASVTFLIGLILAGYLYFSYSASSSISLTNILDVYGQRESFDRQSGIIGSLITGYIIYGIIPFYIFMHRSYGNWLYLFSAFFLGFITFLATGSKLFLGSIFLMILLARFYKVNFSHSRIGLFLMSLILLSYAMSSFFNSYIMLSLFVRRMLVVPAQLFALFHEYVSHNGFNYLAKYTSFLTDSDKISIAHAIGNKYYRIGSSANNGIISDAYGNFGILGVLFYALFFVFIFRYIDKLNIDMNMRLTPLFIGLAISLTNSSLLAVFVFQILMLIVTFETYRFINKVKK